MTSLKKLFFGDYSTREIKRIKPLQQKVLELESKYEKLSDKELTAQTQILKDRLANGETTDDILPDAFAAVSYTHLDVYKRQSQAYYHILRTVFTFKKHFFTT